MTCGLTADAGREPRAKTQSGMPSPSQGGCAKTAPDTLAIGRWSADEALYRTDLLRERRFPRGIAEIWGLLFQRPATGFGEEQDQYCTGDVDHRQRGHRPAQVHAW